MRTIRLLLVEDSQDDEALLVRELRRGGWEVAHQRVVTADDMRCALEDGPWDLIIADYALPSFTGVDALAIAREKRSEVPFILVSGTMGEEVAVHAMQTGADDYLFKGNLARLTPAVERALREAATRRAARSTQVELRKREVQLADAQKLAHLGTWHVDLSANSVAWSIETYRILGQPVPSAPRQDMTLEQFAACVHPEDRADFEHAVRSPNASQFAQDCRIVRPDRTVRYVHIRGDITRDPTTFRTTEVAGMIQDITERKHAEYDIRRALEEAARAKEAAEAANRAKDQFLAVLSHELRTPLTPVMLTISLLERSELSEEALADVREIRSNVELEARLIDDLLDLTRITQGKLQLFPETVDAHQAIRYAVDICCADRAADLHMLLEADKHHVHVDPARLRQVFWNILSNAAKFTREGKSITVRSLNTGGDRLVVEIADQGIGIASETLPRIFNAFEQADTSLTRKYGGLGLGLAISKAMVEAHGGRISAHSDGLGAGTTIRVELPTVPAETPAPARAGSGNPPRKTRSLHILVVEDHEETRVVITRLLKELGHTVISVGTVREAIEALQGEHVELIVSDIGLPDGTGRDILHKMGSKYPGKALALSGFGTDDDIRKSLEAGFVEHLIKPIDLETLEAAIDRAVGVDT